MQISLGDVEVGMAGAEVVSKARLQAAPQSGPWSWGKAWPFPRPSWNVGLLLGVERKCDFPCGV